VKRAWCVLVIGACSLQRMQEQPRCEPDGTLAGEACDRPPPAGIVAWHAIDEAPPPVTRQLVERGRDRYDRYCAACHGAAGEADTEVNRATRGRVPSLLAPAIAALPDDRVLAAIANGRGDMPREPLAARDRWAVLHYVRVLQQRDVPYDEVRGAAPW
jgi:mono/diheme cytochrome c family protein